jgi:hypothetical protein
VTEGVRPIEARYWSELRDKPPVAWSPEEFQRTLAHFEAVLGACLLASERLYEVLSPYGPLVRLDKDVDLFVGLSTDPLVGVTSSRFREGTVIFVTQAFMTFVRAATYLIAAITPHPNEPGGVEARPVTKEDGAANFDFVLAQAYEGSPQHFEIPGLPSHTRKYADVLMRSVLEFAIAHELGHVLAGHFERLGPQDRFAEYSEEFPRAMFTQMEELEADDIAIKILAQPPFEWPEDEMRFFGVVTFSELIDAADQYAFAHETGERAPSGADYRAWSSHPHPVARRAAALAANLVEGLSATVPMCDAILASFDELRRRQAPHRDRRAFDELEAAAAKVDKDAYHGIYGRVPKTEGMRMINDSEVERMMRSGEEAAISFVAYAAIRYLNKYYGARCLVATFEHYLGYLYGKFQAAYLSGRDSKSALRFDGLVREVIPELDEIVEFAREYSTIVRAPSP